MTRRSARRLVLAAAVIVCALQAAACGYGLAGRASAANTVIPEHVRVIAVLPFENRTTRPEIEQRIAEGVASELSRRGRYRIVTTREGADAVLEGAVVRYTTTPVQFTATSGRASRVEAQVTVQASLRDTRDDELIWSQTGLLFREQFDVPETGEFFDQETLALDDLAQGAAEAVVTSILEGW